MLSLSHIIPMVLGGIGTFILLIAALSTDSGNIRGAASAGFALLHFFIVIIALPFLLNAIHKKDEIPIWFYRIIMAESILNSVFMLLASNALSGDKTIYFVSAVLELLPVYWLRNNRHKINILTDE